MLRDGGLGGSGWGVVLAGGTLGGVVGVISARRVAMTAMPQLVSLFNAVGGGAAALLAIHELGLRTAGAAAVGLQSAVTGSLDIVIGGVTFTGSLVAAGKLQGLVPGRPITFSGNRFVNAALALAAVGLIARLVASPTDLLALGLLAAVALAFGVTMVLPIGGADIAGRHLTAQRVHRDGPSRWPASPSTSPP